MSSTELRTRDTVADRAPIRAAIVAQIRRKIIDGDLKPGQRVPARAEMLEAFGTSKVTLQLAFDQLKRDAFIYCESNHGTFVSERPPHLCHYALVMGADPEGKWADFSNALQNEAAGVELERRCRIFCYTGVEEHEDNEAYQRLLSDVDNHRLAGVIFAASIQGLANSRLMTMPRLPRVVNVHTTQPIPGAISVVGDIGLFITKALDHFSNGGRRRVALVSDRAFLPENMELFRGGAADRGIQTDPAWMHFTVPRAAQGLVQLLMRLPPSERPDALFIADDNLVEQASAGLLAAGVKIGKEIDVVAHCNFPWPTPALVPTRRLGWQVREYLNVMIDVIDRQVRGEECPPLIRVPPVFEDELEERGTHHG